MPPSDNDTSDDETQEEFTTTNVLLGYASKEPTDDSFSQLGGYPRWLEPAKPPSAHLARCKVCHSMMALLLQLNGELPERFPNHDRRLYIFACKAKTCRRKEGSMRAIRAVKMPEVIPKKARTATENKAPQEDRSQKKPPQNLGSMLFNSSPPLHTYGNANPFSSSPSPTPNPFSASTQANPFSSQGPSPKSPSPASNPPLTSSTLSETFAQKVRLSSVPPPPAPCEPWPPASEIPSPYPSYHLDADFEALDAPSLSSSSTARAMDIDDPPSSTSKDEDAVDTFESPSLDKAFRRFADRLAQNPLQVLRYEFAGSPLLYSKTDAVGKLLAPHQSPPPTTNKKITTTTSTSASSHSGMMPPCPNCTAPRVFELQLTPQAIAELEAEEMGLEGMEWGNVILGVCSADCMPRDAEVGHVGYAEEWVGVQWEELGAAGTGGKR